MATGLTKRVQKVHQEYVKYHLVEVIHSGRLGDRAVKGDRERAYALVVEDPFCSDCYCQLVKLESVSECCGKRRLECGRASPNIREG